MSSALNTAPVKQMDLEQQRVWSSRQKSKYYQYTLCKIGSFTLIQDPLSVNAQRLTCSSCGCLNHPLRWDIWGCCKGAGTSHSRRGRVYHRAGWSGSGSPCSPLHWQCNTLKDGLKKAVRHLLRRKSKARWELLKRHVKSYICDPFHRESGFSDALSCY